jgi:hypothetical protein
MHTLSTAINAVLRGSVAASKSELTASVARVLGFDRTGNHLDRAISDQIELDDTNSGDRRYRRKTRDYAIGKRRIEDLCQGISRKLVDLTVSLHCDSVKKQ